MNSDSESLQSDLLHWLLAHKTNTNGLKLLKCKEIDGVDDPLKQVAAFTSSDLELGGMPQTFQLGEIPTVQERFQALLKRRLQIQAQEQPPLFPWESQLVDYPDFVEEPSLVLTPNWGWIPQQSELNLPIPLPDKVFQKLLEKCQGLITSSLPLGAKLVQVVESFFPHESQTINDLAGLVLRSTYRSVSTLETIPQIHNNYSDLQPRQQMALSLLAAKQLLDNLTLPVSLANPVVERQWLTSAGTLTVRVECHSQHQPVKLRVDCELPVPGNLKLQGNGQQAIANAAAPGNLSVELDVNQPVTTYTLEVDFPELDEQSLLFAISYTI
ncbi:PatU [Anabaenopsis elenkinii]|uniref:PatU n=1 Tax=Anabaenopsis elenkinii CCIBt3563 TaxID=2779889 RepID=A0A7S6RC19_9CYAN|nr:PatU [Anabaenopsis elenkinii]QOV22191.1 PatU [Anabaenopsis elenkinii CCIBt3563]